MFLSVSFCRISFSDGMSQNTRTSLAERVRIARRAMKPSVSQDDLSGKLARLGVQITQTSLSKIENRQRYVMDYEILAGKGFAR
jgi:Trp operon repressor